ncbi:hypothetical protein [Kribbella ginsengisoli]|uniref:Helicase XPB/Ssl2 N-terminal domain-containing protein n=1 Tax=Kribbella ginsengisoli TaxID=363865 RepID=A0ABP6VX81_9ACTN
MDEEFIELLLGLAKDELGADLDNWQPGQLTTVLYDLLPYSGSVRPGWIDELRAAFPQFVTILRQTGRLQLADLLEGEAEAALNDPGLGRTDPVDWCRYRRRQNALGGTVEGRAELPVERRAELPAEPLPGSPTPVALMPSRLAAAAAGSELLGDLHEFALEVYRTKKEQPEHRLWRIAVLAGWICPSPVSPQYGPSMHAWSPDDPELTPARPLVAWLETYRVVLTESPSLIEVLLTAFRDGTAAAAEGTEQLERLGAVTVVEGRLGLTAIGVRGLFTRGRWADPEYWLLDPGQWWANLRSEDLIAFMTAASKLCLVEQAWSVQRWFEQADPLEFAYQLVRLGSQVHGAVLNTVFGYLLRIGLEAAPAVEEWLVTEELSGLGWVWFDAIGAPMAGIPTEHAQYLATTEMVRSLDDLRALLDWYAEYPPEPPLPGTTIDELMFAVPLRIGTARVNTLVQRVLNAELAEEPGDRDELFGIIAAAREQLLE